MTGIVSVVLVAMLPVGVALGCIVSPPEHGAVAAVFPPWSSATNAIVAAGTAGRVMRFGALPFVVVVDASDRAALREAGAWLFLDPGVMGGCGVLNRQPEIGS